MKSVAGNIGVFKALKDMDVLSQRYALVTALGDKKGVLGHIAWCAANAGLTKAGIAGAAGWDGVTAALQSHWTTYIDAVGMESGDWKERWGSDRAALKTFAE